MEPPSTPITPLETDAQMSRRHLRRKRQIVLGSLIALLLVSCAYRFYQYHHYVTRPLVLTRSGSNSQPLPLADKINPNRAPWSSLTRLPGIGPQRAQDIIEYRKQYDQKRHDSSQPFSNAQDLQKIKGIGPKTVEKLKDYLVFQ
ncbi:MAG: helix-hairpin-helix domain-containing protein [Phycisphaerae bacterium]|nr:helix-hairpin-helix domain-containing protein [Phycisphaerae bacterium]